MKNEFEVVYYLPTQSSTEKVKERAQNKSVTFKWRIILPYGERLYNDIMQPRALQRLHNT